MTDEEKKAIEGLFHLAHINTYLDLEKEDVVKISRVIIKEWKDETKIVLNLIEKKSKEIEELKDRNKKLQDKAKELIFEKQELSTALLDSTPIDKIKAKIEELEKGNKNTFIRGEKILVLQSLLEKE